MDSTYNICLAREYSLDSIAFFEARETNLISEWNGNLYMKSCFYREVVLIYILHSTCTKKNYMQENYEFRNK